MYAEMQQHIYRLTSDPDTADRDELIAAIVDCARPLSTLLTTSMRTAEQPARSVLVEAMARRYYRVRSLEGFERVDAGGHTFVRRALLLPGATAPSWAAYVELEDVAGAAAAFMRQIESLPEGEPAVLDLYAEHLDAAPPTRSWLSGCMLRSAASRCRARLHRIVIAVAEPRRGRGMSAIDLFTFRPGPDGLVEDEVLRGLHPMMGHRLQVWRLQEFELERLPSAEDIYTFHGVAHTNPKDERLFALAEVRDLTRIYDDEGNIVALPELEQVVVRVLATLRSFQARRPISRRLLWNRVLLHVWPVMEPDPDEIHRLVERLAPLTTGLGIEMISFQGEVREPDGVVRRRVLQFFAPARARRVAGGRRSAERVRFSRSTREPAV